MGQLPAQFKTTVTEMASETQVPANAGNGLGEATVQIPEDEDIRHMDSMTQMDQSRKDVHRPWTLITKPKEITNIGCWNVRTLYTIGKSAQLAREMNRYDIDILGISECRWTGYGKVKLNTGESVIFSGREDNLHHHGVAIMMSTKAEQALLEWKPISERIIYARFFSKYIKLSVIQVYAPTNDANEEDKDHFYEQLQAVVEGIQKHDLLIVMGDLNAKVGDNKVGFENVMGGHGIGVSNENGEKLLDFCGLNNLLVTGTIFPLKLVHKQTWTSPGGQTKNQIDHVLVTRHHRTSVMDTWAMRGADIIFLATTN